MNREVDASALERIAASYIEPLIVFAAVDLGLFDALDEPRTVAELADRTGATVDGLERLCRALHHFGLVRVAGALVEAAPGLAGLLGPGDASIAPLLRHHHRHIVPVLSRLAEAVKTGHPQHAAWPFAGVQCEAIPYAELARHRTEMDTFLIAMDHASRGVGRGIAGAVDLTRARRLVDLGCGGGRVARELLAALPSLTIESYDLPGACDVARQRSADAGNGDRHTVGEGDIRVGVASTGADAALLAAVLADWPRGERAAILRTARAVLRPGGLLLVSETLLDDDRKGPANAAIISIILLAGMRGDQLSFGQLREELERAGFVEAERRHAGPRDLVVARAA